MAARSLSVHLRVALKMPLFFPREMRSVVRPSFSYMPRMANLPLTTPIDPVMPPGSQ